MLDENEKAMMRAIAHQESAQYREPLAPLAPLFGSLFDGLSMQTPARLQAAADNIGPCDFRCGFSCGHIRLRLVL